MTFSETSRPPHDASRGPGEAGAPAHPTAPTATGAVLLPAGVAALLGWLGVALDNARVVLSLPRRASGPATRFFHLLFDLGHTLAIGVLAWALVSLVVERLRVRLPRAYGALALASIVVFERVLNEDLSGFAGRWFGARATWGLPLLCAALALMVPAAALASRLPGRPLVRGPVIAIALALIAVNDYVLVNDYRGAHLWIATTGATLLGASLTGLVIPGRAASVISALPRRGAWAALAVIAAGAAASIAVAPSSAVKGELLERDTAYLASVVTSLHPPRRPGKASVPRELEAAFTPRADRAPVPPTVPGVLPPGGIVILVTVDALRADVFSPQYAKSLPHLNELREHAVLFSEARSFSTGTRFSMAALLTGRHLSMLKSTSQTKDGKQSYRNDKLPRVQEILAQRGVKSAQASALPLVFAEDVGLVRGFTEHFLFDDGEALKGTPEVMQHAFEQLKKQGPEPFFYYMHLMDPHQPYYDHGKPTQGRHEAYMHEVAYADEWIGRLRQTIREVGIADRTMLILAADHGEAFGEHGLYTHNKALYEILVRIPLVIEYPGVTPRTDDTYVSLLDFAPTILDALHVSAPGYLMGDSLVPLLTGQKLEKERVVYMEQRASRAALFPDGIKVILTDNPRNEEVYDLRQDPGEENNLRDGALGNARAALTWKYLKTHAWKRGQPPRSLRLASAR
jgi:choline-sulfatase